MKEIRIIIAGSRTFSDYAKLKINVHKIVANLIASFDSNNIRIISGTANGTDKLGERFAKEYGYKLSRFPANWSIGKRAGYIRNEKMAQIASEEDCYGVLIAFWDGESKGTKHMIYLAEKYGLEVHVIKYKE